MIKILLLKSALFVFCFSIGLNKIFAQTPEKYPKITGYVGILHPIISFNKNQTTTNFTDYYIGGLPTGINIWKTHHIAFSMEFVPFIRAQNGDSKMYNLLFHPGILIRLAPKTVFAGRVAFETGGRYGITPVINKVVKRNKNCNYFVAIPLPLRFGNNLPSSLGIGFQFGIGF